MTLRTAWGRITLRWAFQKLIPRAVQASDCAFGTPSTAERKISAVYPIVVNAKATTTAVRLDSISPSSGSPE